MMYLVEEKHLKRKRRWSIIRLCLYFLLLAVACFALAKVAAGLLSTTTDGKHAVVSKGYIALDPGHGGEGSPGCVYGGLLERDITLELALRIKEKLVKQGYTVIMTREVDETVTLEERAEIVNRSGADLCISFHLNAHDDASVHGIETWFNPDTNSRSSALAEYIQQSIVVPTKGKDRGTYSDTTLVMTREVLIPSCLVELGYLSNDKEREKMSTEVYREKIAQGVIDGVEQYFKRYPDTR
ncbi:MAG: N-acetylmuramoyl-L-alanine amidase family protein [Syntrophomonadales bacterium]|jgi:N-acetylmuramoyl-L-alanine amidase